VGRPGNAEVITSYKIEGLSTVDCDSKGKSWFGEQEEFVKRPEFP